MSEVEWSEGVGSVHVSSEAENERSDGSLGVLGTSHTGVDTSCTNALAPLNGGFGQLSLALGIRVHRGDNAGTVANDFSRRVACFLAGAIAVS